MKSSGSGSAMSVRSVHGLRWVVFHKAVRLCLVERFLHWPGHHELDPEHERVSWSRWKSRCEANPDASYREDVSEQESSVTHRPDPNLDDLSDQPFSSRLH